VEPFLLKAFEELKRHTKMEKTARSQIRSTIQRLIDIYTKLGKPDELAKWQAEAKLYSSTKSKSND
ncbi:MAG: hypothetical protein ACRCZF_24520, partial [Gemmataceae bacterium]